MSSWHAASKGKKNQKKGKWAQPWHFNCLCFSTVLSHWAFCSSGQTLLFLNSISYCTFRDRRLDQDGHWPVPVCHLLCSYLFSKTKLKQLLLNMQPEKALMSGQVPVHYCRPLQKKKKIGFPLLFSRLCHRSTALAYANPLFCLWFHQEYKTSSDLQWEAPRCFSKPCLHQTSLRTRWLHPPEAGT